ncbi:MAG: AAA family ATPase, partial [Fusobacteriaceae bacterium]
IQVIISTQSVTLVNNFELEEIIVVDKENTESVFKKMDILNFREWLEDYTIGELWEMNLLGGRP